MWKDLMRCEDLVILFMMDFDLTLLFCIFPDVASTFMISVDLNFLVLYFFFMAKVYLTRNDKYVLSNFCFLYSCMLFIIDVCNNFLKHAHFHCFLTRYLTASPGLGILTSRYVQQATFCSKTGSLSYTVTRTLTSV